MGTPEFAVPSLRLLHHAELIDVIAVITQPDRPAGRGKKLQISPVKQYALENEIFYLQPSKIKNDKEVIDYLKNSNADAFVTVAFGQILSKEILDIPPLGTINLHASLLPEYRGPNPIQWAIINGDKKTGVTTMLTEEGIDCGDILIKHEVPILLDYDSIKLTRDISNIGARVLADTVLGLCQGTITPVKQDHSKATKAPKLKKEKGNISWNDTTLNIHNIIRGTRPWPGSYTSFNGKIIKINKSFMPGISDDNKEFKPGSIINITKTAIQVRTGDGYIELLELQPPNKPVMPAKDWARGARVKPGDMFIQTNE